MAQALAATQATDLGWGYDNKTGRITPCPTSEGGDVRVVTSYTVPGMVCEAVDAPVARLTFTP